MAKVSKPPREIQTEGLDSAPEVAAVVQQLRAARQTLDAKSRELPADSATLDQVAKLKDEIATLTIRILASGYPEEVLIFIAQARQPRGVSLADVLKNSTVRKWLEEKNHAASFRVVHESAIQLSALRP